MAKFRKKPVVVEAVQWFKAGDHPAVKLTASDRGEPRGIVQTAGGKAIVDPGDWVIAEPDGRGFYPCKPDIFAATYEPADDELAVCPTCDGARRVAVGTLGTAGGPSYETCPQCGGTGKVKA